MRHINNNLKRVLLIIQMNLVINAESIHKRHIFFYDQVENKVMINSVFIQTGYSNELFSLSGVYINTEFYVNRMDKYFKKIRYNFEYTENTDIINSLIKIERMILDNIDRPDLTKMYKLKEQLNSSTILVFENNESTKHTQSTGIYRFILKISGVWVSETSCGITFKFFQVND